MSSQALLFSLVLPCFNEEKTIATFLPRDNAVCAKLFGQQFEIIAINDGSRDKTENELQKLQKKFKNVKVISYQQNKGKGHAVRRGVLAAQGKTVAYMDSDGEISPQHLRQYYPWIANGYDIVLASKTHPRSNAKFSLKRKLMSQTYRALTQVLFGLKIQDPQAGLKVFSQKVAQEIFPLVQNNGYGFDIEWLAHALAAGFSIKPCPVKITHQDSQSTITRQRIVQMIRETIASALRFRAINMTKSLTPSRKEWARARYASFL